MEKAVRFDGVYNQIEVKYHLEVDTTKGIRFQTVLEAMDVSLIISLSYPLIG